MEQPLLSTSGGLGFDLPVSNNGYRWWYVDGFSECGSHGVTLIFFIGTVFSPFMPLRERRAILTRASLFA